MVPSVWRLSYLSGVLSEGDKRNSKGDMLGVFLLHTVKEEKEARSRGYFAPEPASRTRPVRGWTDQKVVWELLTLSTEEDPGYNEALGRSRFVSNARFRRVLITPGYGLVASPWGQ